MYHALTILVVCKHGIYEYCTRIPLLITGTRTWRRFNFLTMYFRQTKILLRKYFFFLDLISMSTFMTYLKKRCFIDIFRIYVPKKFSLWVEIIFFIHRAGKGRHLYLFNFHSTELHSDPAAPQGVIGGICWDTNPGPLPQNSGQLRQHNRIFKKPSGIKYRI